MKQPSANVKTPNSQAQVRALILIAIVYIICSIFGITWGLPSSNIDKYLFGDNSVWSGEKIYRLAGAGEKFDGDLGADVDPDPLNKASLLPILLTDTDEKIAMILLRYRLYTYQPDEMITMMALAGMKPSAFDFDPKLYQYGGLFIYPVGAIIKLCGLVGLIDVRSDVTYYLDHPDEFGKFYIVARAYAALWGLLGVMVVFLITRRIANEPAAVLASLLFACMPVVVCMAHEGKPHLPGAVLMLIAVMFGMRQLSANGNSSRDWWLMCISCGAAFGMVLSSGPIFVLIPLVAWMSVADSTQRFYRTSLRTVFGVAVGISTYVVCNPYILVNALTNRDILRSNFGNSLAMYNIERIGEGFLRVIDLTAEGATAPILLLGVIATFVAVFKKRIAVLPLLVPAAVFFLQFVLIGAGKPAEYGRFGIFTDTALAIGAACLLVSIRKAEKKDWRLLESIVILWVVIVGVNYLGGFHEDALGRGSRQQLASAIEASRLRIPINEIATTAEPAPYCFPPIDFSKTNLWLVKDNSLRSVVNSFPSRSTEIISASDKWSRDAWHMFSNDSSSPQNAMNSTNWPAHESFAMYNTPISWASKPFYWQSINSDQGPIETKKDRVASPKE